MIGSHNSMSYLPVRQWYLKPFWWTARCQSKTLSEQYRYYEVRLFDFRIRFDKNGDLVFAHGPIEFKGDPRDYLDELNKLARMLDAIHCKDGVVILSPSVYVRLILESNKPMKDRELQEEHFRYFCEDIQKEYPNITFFGGNRKYDWKEIYHFDTDVQLKDLYSSTTNIFGGSKDHWTAKLDDLWPWLYAKLRNKKNIRNHKDDDGILFIDYVNIR